MFNQGLSLGFLRTNADSSYTKRVFNLYLNRHQDELLGLGYHHYRQSGRGILELISNYRELFFGKGFYPHHEYQILSHSSEYASDVIDVIKSYDPETEVVVQLRVQNSDLTCFSCISKKGLALSVIHRQYLNQLLNRPSRFPKALS